MYARGAAGLGLFEDLREGRRLALADRQVAGRGDEGAAPAAVMPTGADSAAAPRLSYALA
ncbi:hypothetical protein BJP40_26855 [Streptomyces sp. CC53]|uniref:hypothetical protein n=1 Tax=Streptomyces sp. CC53 TaxID=1906740 RepID=UPI0008DDB52F|nr:hypothetical protein BJP40_26855 [Streptomyces sp. CC53]